MPAGIRLLSSNGRYHWSVRAAITHDIRKAAWACAKQAKIPPLKRASIIVEYQPPLVKRKRDAENVQPSGKAAIDGITDALVFADDNSEYVVSVKYTIGEPFPRGRIVIHITEVLDVPVPAAGEVAGTGHPREVTR
jgi:Holliday junction resolvase RusA-like endonuclease